jgi:hypothetical protein
MRYYRGKLTNPRVAEWAIIGLAGAIGELQAGHPLWVAELLGIGILLLFFVIYRSWYWEICPDCLIHRRYFRRVVWPFTEITYVGPMTGLIGTYSAVRGWLEVRNVSGKMIIVQPANCEEFLGEMRKYLPRITLNR